VALTVPSPPMGSLSKGIVGALLVLSAGALADPNDVRLYQLGNPTTAGANANFRAFARELGVAMSSVNLMPPETLGHAGFSVTAEASYVFLQGKDGSGSPCSTPTASCFLFPNEELRGNGVGLSGMLIPSVHVRKGLPFSFELGSRIGWVEKSRMATLTGEVKWALNEGFTYLPDVGIRASVTRLLNSRELDVTSGGVDIGVGKQFAIGGMITLTPYVGWNLIWVGASSGSVDFRPERTQQEATANPTAQLADSNVYDPVAFFSNSHNRFYGGVRFIGGVVQLLFEVSYASMGKFNDPTTSADRVLPDVAAINVSFGLDF
jgi:hypothetical protein